MDPRASTTQPQHAPGNVQQGYTQSSTGPKYAKNDNLAYPNQSNRQPEFQQSPRFGRSVATVIPMNSKTQSLDVSKEGCPDSFPRGQMMCPSLQRYDSIPSDPCSIQNFHRLSLPGSSQGNPANAIPYQSSSSAVMGGVRDAPQNFNQMSMDMMQSPMKRFPVQQQLSSGSGSRFVSSQYPLDISQQMTSDVMSGGDLEFRGIISPYTNTGPSCKPIQGGQQRQGTRPPSEIYNRDPNQFSQSQAQCMTLNSSPRNSVMFVPMNSRPDESTFDNQLVSPGVFPTIANSGPRMNSPQNVQSTRMNILQGKVNMGNSVSLREAPNLLSQTSGPAHSIPLPLPGTVCALCRKEIASPQEKLQESPTCRQQQLPPIQCEAGCREWFHLPCSGLTLDAFFLLKAEPMAEWLCNPCATQAYPNIPYIKLRQ